MFSLEKIIFSLFGKRDYINDKFKDGNGRGLNQRFNELLAKDLDDNEITLINRLVENTANPMLCFERFIPYHEQTFGVPVFLPDLYIRRKILHYIRHINRRRGTKSGYILLFRMLGFQDAQIVEHLPVFGFDSPGRFDDPDRRFDQKCKGCSKYTINLFGNLVISSQMIQAVLTVVDFNEPINAVLQSINYNGQPLVNGQQISMYVDTNGDLIFINPFDPSFVAWIDGNGDLKFDSDNADFYEIDDNGDLIFTT